MSEDVCGCLGISGDLWEYLRMYGDALNFWEFLRISGDVWDVWGCLEMSGDVWGRLVIPGDAW